MVLIATWIVMLSIELLPHHHHPGSDGICLNAMHCQEYEHEHRGADCCEQQDSDDACAGHSHDRQNAPCAVKQLYLLKTQEQTAQHFTFAVPVALLPPTFVPADGKLLPATATLLPPDKPDRTPATRLCVEYIARALPARASTVS